MGEKTNIEWCDSVLNLQMGCDGCELADRRKPEEATCYAHTLTERYAGRKGWPDDFFTPKLFVERLEKALAWKSLFGTKRPGKPWLDGQPRVIFLDDMGDTFTESLDPAVWLAPLLPKIAQSPHLFLCLTKRPERQREFAERFVLPANFWAGSSVTSQQNGRLAALMKTRAAKRFISAEPLFAKINFKLPCQDCGGRFNYADWLILGGLSGATQIGDESWIAEPLDQAREAGIPVFVKQGFGHRTPGDISDLPEALRVREFPPVPMYEFPLSG
jgi:protein gp37